MIRYLLGALVLFLTSDPAFAQAVHQTAGPIGAGDQFTWGNAATLGSVFVIGVTLWFTLDKRTREERKTAQDASDRIMGEFHKVYVPLSTKVEKLEDRTKDQITKTQSEKDIDHLKVNRQQAEAGIDNRLRQAERDIIDLGKAQARTETKHDGLAQDVAAIKHQLETQDGKLDKMQDCLTAISVKIDRTS